MRRALEGASDQEVSGEAPEASAPTVPSEARRALAARAEGVRAQRKRRRRVAAACLAAALVLVASGAAFALRGAPVVDDFFDEVARSGQAPNRTPAELQAELNRKVEEGMFRISIESAVEFPSPSSPGKAFIENVPANPYDMTVEIALADTGETLYRSKGIAPGSYVEEVSLSRELEPGVHDALATFTAHDRETREEVGKAVAEIVLLVDEG